MVKSGLFYSFGIGFWGPNGHDGVWHIALAESLSRGNWHMPIFAGETIKNYHLGFDLIIAIFHKFTFIPIPTLYFQIIPPLLALFLGFFVYRFVHLWQKNKMKAFWSVFFTYFAGSFGWIVSLIREGRIDGESIFWAQQPISSLINPPFGLSIVFIFASLYLLLLALKSGKNSRMKYLTLSVFLLGSLAQIKVYAVILILAGLFAGGFWQLLKERNILLIKVATSVLIISILVFSPITRGVGKMLVFRPFWFLETMMLDSDRIGWNKFGEAMINYKLGQIWFKEFLAYSVALLIFILGNFGTRVLAFFWFWKKGFKFNRYQYIDVLITTVIILGIILPLFFIQTGTPWNTIQFMYYSLLFSGILAGVVLGEIFEKLKKKTLAIYTVKTALVFLTLPTTFGTLWYHYLPKRPPAMISRYEIEALNFLAKLPDGVVLTQPFDKDKAFAVQLNPPRPLYLYESTAYVSAFSRKQTFIEDEVNLEITGYYWKDRKEKVEPFFEKNCKVDKSFFGDNNISYVYLIKQNLCNKEFEDLGNKLFENLEVVIYKISDSDRS